MTSSSGCAAVSKAVGDELGHEQLRAVHGGRDDPPLEAQRPRSRAPRQAPARPARSPARPARHRPDGRPHPRRERRRSRKPDVLGAQLGVLRLQGRRPAMEGRHRLAERVDHHRLVPALGLQALQRRARTGPSGGDTGCPFAEAVRSDCMRRRLLGSPVRPKPVSPGPAECPCKGREMGLDGSRSGVNAGRAPPGHAPLEPSTVARPHAPARHLREQLHAYGARVQGNGDHPRPRRSQRPVPVDRHRRRPVDSRDRLHRLARKDAGGDAPALRRLEASGRDRRAARRCGRPLPYGRRPLAVQRPCASPRRPDSSGVTSILSPATCACATCSAARLARAPQAIGRRYCAGRGGLAIKTVEQARAEAHRCRGRPQAPRPRASPGRAGGALARRLSPTRSAPPLRPAAARGWPARRRPPAARSSGRPSSRRPARGAAWPSRRPGSRA